MRAGLPCSGSLAVERLKGYDLPGLHRTDSVHDKSCSVARTFAPTGYSVTKPRAVRADACRR